MNLIGARNAIMREEISNTWFKNHVVEMEMLNGNMQVINWYNPESKDYAIRYTIVGQFLYIEGYFGKSSFKFDTNMNLALFKFMSPEFFNDRCTASEHPMYAFSSQIAIQEIKNWYNQMLPIVKYEDDKRKLTTLVADLCMDSKAIHNVIGWTKVIAQKIDDINHFDMDASEWMMEAGNIIPTVNYAYLIGLQMALEKWLADLLVQSAV